MNLQILRKRVDNLIKLNKPIIIWEINPVNGFAINFFRQNGIEPLAIMSFGASEKLRKAWGTRVLFPDSYLLNSGVILCISQSDYLINRAYLASVMPLKNVCIDYIYDEKSYNIDRYIQIVRSRLTSIVLKEKEKISYFLFIKDKIIDLVEGLHIYTRLVKKYSNAPFFLFNYVGMGDIVIPTTIINKYIVDNSIEKYIAIVGSGACYKIAKIVGYENVIKITSKELMQLEYFLSVIGYENHSFKRMISTVHYNAIAFRMAGIKLNLLDTYNYCIFDYDCRQAPVFNIVDNEYDVSELFSRHGLRIGKTVILSPYSNSQVSASEEYWKRIAKLFLERGYSVATMCSGNEHEIFGTVRFEFDLYHAFSVLEQAGFFIGTRSGFCDLVFSANCKKIIIYFENNYGEYFDFYKMTLSHINSKSIYEWASFEKMGFDLLDTKEIRSLYTYDERMSSIFLDFFEV